MEIEKEKLNIWDIENERDRRFLMKEREENARKEKLLESLSDEDLEKMRQEKRAEELRRSEEWEKREAEGRKKKKWYEWL